MKCIHHNAVQPQPILQYKEDHFTLPENFCEDSFTPQLLKAQRLVGFLEI